MTVSNQNPLIQYIATNGQTIFSGTFEILQNEDVAVYRKPADASANDVTDLLMLNADYTISGAGVNTTGFTMTLIVGANTGDVITLLRAMPIERTTSFNNGGSLQAEDLNLEYDAQVLISQQVNMQALYKTPKYLNSTIVQTKDLGMPQLAAGQCWRMNDADTGIEAVNFDDNDPGAGILRADLASHNSDEGASLIGTVGGTDTVQNVINLTNPDRLQYPQGDGENRQIIETNGQKVLTFIDPPIVIGMSLNWKSPKPVPARWLSENGSAINRVTYAELLTALTITQVGTTHSNNSITGLTDTSGMYTGMPIEGAGIPSSTTVVSIVSGTSITISNSATTSATSTLTFFPWGNGDGAATFNLPDSRGRSAIGSGTGAGLSLRITGEIGGEQNHLQLLSELVGHTHSFTPAAVMSNAVGHQLANGTDFDYNTISTVSGSQGGGMPFNVMHPFYVATSIIYAGV